MPSSRTKPKLICASSAALPGASVVLLHSGLAEGARREHWREAATGKASLVLGTRLGVFAPMPALAAAIAAAAVPGGRAVRLHRVRSLLSSAYWGWYFWT